MEKVFVVEDNDSIREAVVSYLKLDNYQIIEFSRLHGVIEAVKMQKPDLLILDVMLPDGDGFQLAKRIRGFSDIPILFLTAKTAESDRITGFEIGGDDYVVKPFSPKELTLRVKSLLKRTVKKVKEGSAEWELDQDVLFIDNLSHRAILNGRDLPLTAAEWKILITLTSSPGILFSRDRLLGESLDYLAEGSERTIDTHVKNLRAKLGRAGWIETVRGWGYRFSGKRK
ncbi:MAG: transcriptional regulator [Spirochaetes bacterium DG_61]|jgi:DNA-binding response OmpR family regulator|nr:MAG: transcriptional regulator [Spirochaetes bacterium DG_61]